MLASRHGAPSNRAFGRVDDEGVVYVKTADGGERAVGSYPGATAVQALDYFGRKYDDLLASVDLMLNRLEHTEVSTRDVSGAVDKLAEQCAEPNVVGDLAALNDKLARVTSTLAARRQVESESRRQARSEAATAREALVVEAESIAATPVERIHWRTSGDRMRELLDAWKDAQRHGPRLEREVETAMWSRFGSARNSFDKARRAHFAELDATRTDAKSAKDKLVADAEALATSTDWASTAGEFKRLMDRWRAAGRAGRTEDDALWHRFKAAQDAFFAAKDAVVAAEDESLRANLVVKEALLVEANALLPVKDVEATKSALRGIQDRWDTAGKVPRADLERTERALKRVEQAVRDLDERKWTSSNPEAAARARSFVDQLSAAVADLERDLAAATAKGDKGATAKAQAALDTKRAWLKQAEAGLAEFGG